jgi:xylose isomerase
MTEAKSLHSICAWTFHSGAGGFVPDNIRPEWSADRLSTVGKIEIIAKRIKPRIPDNIVPGLEMHYDYEFNENNAREIADALVANDIFLAMITPGAHRHFGYGGIASLDPRERKAAEEFGESTVELAYGPLRRAWHPEPNRFPALVLWNGSYGYDVATVGIQRMYENLKESVAKLCRFESELGGELFVALEPKPNEGHPAMLLPTVASSLLFWTRLEEQYGIPLSKKGINKEFGHTEMIGLDHVLDTVEELDNEMLVHMHINSQGYNDGIIYGGPGKFDIDHGARVNGMNITIARLIRDAGYNRWKGHDMQARPYDNEEQAVERIIRSILSWEACSLAAEKLDTTLLLGCLAERNTIKAEDIMREAVVDGQKYFDEMY